MANVVAFNVYQINQRMLARDQSQRIAFPTLGCLLRSCIDSPTRSLRSGYNVYGVIQTADGSQYYVGETIAQLVTSFG